MRKQVLGETLFQKPSDGWEWPAEESQGFQSTSRGVILSAPHRKFTFEHVLSYHRSWNNLMSEKTKNKGLVQILCKFIVFVLVINDNHNCGLMTIIIDSNGMIDYPFRRRNSLWLQINKYRGYGYL